MWLAVHPDMTADARVPDEEGAPTFSIGFWPPRESERLGVLLTRLRKPRADADPDDLDALVKESGLSLDAFRDMARYGVRGWTGFGSVVSSVEEVEIDGRKHKRLTADAVNALYVNRLLIPVALKAMAFNVLSEAEKKTSGSPFGSSTKSPGTSAPDASQGSP